MSTTKTFAYDFTDGFGNIFDLTMIATNSDVTRSDVFIISSITGSVTHNGSSPKAVIGLSDFPDGSPESNTLSNTTGYSTSSYWNYDGVGFRTADYYYKLFYNGQNKTTWSENEFGGEGFPESTAVISGSSVFTDSTVTVSCFLPGTHISTPTGGTPVQNLQIGDLILNNVGQSLPVKWIGTQRLHPAFARDHLPICIRAGALGHDLPLRDLYVSPCHALYIDHCLLIQAKALVNGISITQVTQWEGDIQYFHIETEHHEIILAEGTPTETFMDNVSRACFNNYSEYQTLYPETHEMIELDIPRVNHQRQLPNMVKSKLEGIAEVLIGQEKVQMKA